MLSLYQGPSVSIFVGPGRVHYTAPKALLVKQSKFFDKALGGSFKEAQRNEVELPELDPEIFKHVLHYIFRGELGLVVTKDLDGCDMLPTLIWRWEAPQQAANTLCWTLCRLSFYADNLMMDELVEHINDLLKTFLDAVSYNEGGRPMTMEPDLIMEVFENTVEGSSLRAVVVEEIKQALSQQYPNPPMVHPADYNECFMRIPQLAAEVVGNLSSTIQELHDDERRIYRQSLAPSHGLGRGRGQAPEGHGRGRGRGQGRGRRGRGGW